MGWSIDRNAQKSKRTATEMGPTALAYTERAAWVDLCVSFDLVRKELCVSPFSERPIEKTWRKPHLSNIGFLDQEPCYDMVQCCFGPEKLTM